MKIAVLGTGVVGKTISSKLIELGHEVKMGSRSNPNEKATEWVATAGPKASQGTFAEAAAFGETDLGATAGGRLHGRLHGGEGRGAGSRAEEPGGVRAAGA